MHDIVHDFAQFLTKNECLIMENVVGEAVIERISGKNVRHLNLLKYVANTVMDPYSICQKLCSFFCAGGEIPLTLPSHLKRLRLLSLKSCKLREIPKEIGSLIHLRYLDLRNNDLLERLPETICDLYNLQTLDLRYCRQLPGLPQGVHKLGNLRHLLTKGTSDSFKFPQGFETLRNLQTLGYFFSAKGCDNKLGYLHDLNQLGGSVTLLIHDLNDESDVVEAETADLKNKKFIEHLSLRYTGEVELRIMEALQPPPNLPSLCIEALQLPKWIGTLANIRILNIWCEKIETDRWHSIRNLPFLEKLTLTCFALEPLGLEFLGINKAETKPLISSVFPKLKVLELLWCFGWKEWEDIKEEDENIAVSVLPCLEKLIVSSCPDLKALPHRLLSKASSLQMLDIKDCKYLAERYRHGTGADWDKISHIPSVSIKN